MKNKEKFKKVFGFEPDILSCVWLSKYSCCTSYTKCVDCPKYNWWNENYKKPGGQE